MKLADALEQMAEGVPLRALAEAYAGLSQRYRAGTRDGSPLLGSELERIAYAIARMPATMAAVRLALSEAASLPVRTLLDLGAGTGAAMWAATECFHLHGAEMVERDAAMISVGKRLADWGGLAGQTSWTLGDFAECGAEADLVTMAYSLGEAAPSRRGDIVARAWSKARVALAIIEPGTPAGFVAVNAARTALIDSGASILAPCGHAAPCPMAGSASWCHFAARVDRSRLHREMKGGDLGYEDEKFSYVVAVRTPVSRGLRIVDEPSRLKHQIEFPACSQEGLKHVVVPRREKPAFARARRLGWGDIWTVEEP